QDAQTPSIVTPNPPFIVSRRESPRSAMESGAFAGNAWRRFAEIDVLQPTSRTSSTKRQSRRRERRRRSGGSEGRFGDLHHVVVDVLQHSARAGQQRQ